MFDWIRKVGQKNRIDGARAVGCRKISHEQG